MTRKKTHEEYIQQLKDKSIQYTPLERYINSRTNITHQCLKGHQWKVTPNHILEGRNCPLCSSSKLKTTQEYKQQLVDKGVFYTVLEDYKGALINILHRCQAGHTWKIRPSHVLSGVGCPSCASYAFNPNLPSILYYIKITSSSQKNYYKIGITSSNVTKRFSKDKDKTIQILMQKQFLLGSDARAEEQSILDKYKSHRITIPDFLKSKGNTELFEIDILGLDT